MINIKNISCSFNDKIVLKNLSLYLPNTGLVAICGESGCGKTTFLNCIAGLVKYSGEIEIDRENISSFSLDDMSNYRLKNMGFIFQDFKLFESENVVQNIIFPLDVLSSDSQERKKRKSEDLISLVGLRKHALKSVNCLSGGEKQRVAIARALINDPKIILADEPTGSLDSQNSVEIMKILAKISSKSLVIVVSHDLDLMNQFADQIITLKDGEINKISYLGSKERDAYLPICKNNPHSKVPSMKTSFLFRHTKTMVKRRKWRSLICNLITSFGLLGIGISFSLSRLISSNVVSAYSSIVDDSKIMISHKNEDSLLTAYSPLSKESVSDIQNKYSEITSGIGVYYKANFEEYFCDVDHLVISSGGSNITIPYILGRHINEFEWLDDYDGDVFPKKFNDLENDEIVLGVNIQMISEICYACHIEKSLTSLSNYLENNKITVYFDFAHYEWNYWDQQLLNIVGVTLSSHPGIYHTNHFWNEFMLEDQMRFPANTNFEEVDFYPWTMKKQFYIKTNFQDLFLTKISSDFAYQNYVFDLANSSYYPNLYKDVNPSSRNRYFPYLRNGNSLSISFTPYFQEVSTHIKNPIYGSVGGYAIFPKNMMMGFAGETFFTFSESSLFDVKNSLSDINLQNNETYNLPNDVLSGHYSKSLQSGVIFETFTGKLLAGRPPNTLSEITISSSMASKLFGKVELPNKPLYLSSTISQTIFPNGTSKRGFVDVPLNVVGIVDSPRLAIYHESNWTVLFYENVIGISAFNLDINAISFDVDKTENIDSTLKELSKAFPQFEISYPLNYVKNGISKICGYIEIAVICLSMLAIILSILLLSICNYLHALECQKDIGLARCLGVTNKESCKFIYSHSVFMALTSFISSTIELFFILFASAYVFSENFGNKLTFSIDIWPFGLMLFLSLLISLISSLIIANKIKQKSAIECLKT